MKLKTRRRGIHLVKSPEYTTEERGKVRVQMTNQFNLGKFVDCTCCSSQCGAVQVLTEPLQH